MRLPVVPNVSTKDGQSNKNARLTNCLKETTKRGDKAVIRPGLVLQAEGTGVGGGLVAFNNELVSVYGATLGIGVTPSETVIVDLVSTIPIADSDGVVAVCYLSGNEWLVGVTNYTEGEMQLWRVDTSDDSSALDMSGFVVPDSGGITQILTNGAVVVVTTGTDIYTSDLTDPLSFSSTYSAADNGVADMKYHDEMFVGVLASTFAYTPTFIHSADGSSWTTVGSLGIGAGRGKAIVYDGNVWRGFFTSASGIPPPKSCSTSDFLSFTSETLSGFDMSTYVVTGAARDAIDGSYYLALFRASPAGRPLVYTTDGTTYSQISIGETTIYESPADGVVYGFDYDTEFMYRVSAGVTETVCDTSSFGGDRGIAANGDSSVFLMGTNEAGYVGKYTYSTTVIPGSIPALDEIAEGLYDFAQSPI